MPLTIQIPYANREILRNLFFLDTLNENNRWQRIVRERRQRLMSEEQHTWPSQARMNVLRTMR